MTVTRYFRAVGELHSHAGRKMSLARPASEAKLRKVETEIASKLPAALREAWATADGGEESCPVFVRPGYLTGYDFLSIAGSLAERTAMRKRAPRYEGYEGKKRDRRIRPGWFEPGWLPFAGFGGGTLLLLIDTSPSAKGTRGQVIAFTHDPDDITWVAKSFDDFLAASLKAFEADADEFLLV